MSKPLKCYIAAFHNPEIDPYLEGKGFTHGMIAFSIPDYGVLFRCRVQGELIDLEFGAFFALLKFIRSRLKDANITEVLVHSSNPEFVFSFVENTRHLMQNGERIRLLEEYKKKLKLGIAFVEPLDNKALIPAAEYPSLPDAEGIGLKPEPEESQKISFKPFQKGIKL